RVATLIVLVLAASAMAVYWQRDRLPLGQPTTRWPFITSGPTGATRPSVVRVTPNQSIAAAVLDAVAGTEILVEPGEYREQIKLKTGVRITSRVPRAALLRLPGGASETDAAVVAYEVSDVVF